MLQVKTSPQTPKRQRFCLLSANQARQRFYVLVVAIGFLLEPSALHKGKFPLADLQSYLVAKDRSETTKNPYPIYLILSVIWQGDQISDFNIAALERFRKEFPGVPMVHFLNAAYFTKSSANPKDIVAKIRKVVTPNDSIGVYLVPWKSLALSAKVKFRDSPTFWGNKLSAVDCSLDCGREVSLNAYNEQDVVKLLRRSIVLLEENGFEKPRSFLADGWLAYKHVLNAVVANGIKFDFSAAPVALLKRQLGSYPLYDWLNSLWPEVTAFTEPFSVQTRYGEVTEIVDSALTTDYWSSEELKSHFDSFVAYQTSAKDVALTFHMGVFQESAFLEVEKMAKAVRYVFEQSSKLNLNIKPLTLPGEQQDIARNSRQEKLVH